MHSLKRIACTCKRAAATAPEAKEGAGTVAGGQHVARCVQGQHQPPLIKALLPRGGQHLHHVLHCVANLRFDGMCVRVFVCLCSGLIACMYVQSVGTHARPPVVLGVLPDRQEHARHKRATSCSTLTSSTCTLLFELQSELCCNNYTVHLCTLQKPHLAGGDDGLDRDALLVAVHDHHRSSTPAW